MNQKIHARTRPTTVTNMLSVSTSVTSVTQCTSASVGLAMLEMVSCVERTPTWTAGPIKTLCVALMPLITARRYVLHCIWSTYGDYDQNKAIISLNIAYIFRITVQTFPTLDKKTLIEMAKAMLVTKMTTTMEFLMRGYQGFSKNMEHFTLLSCLCAIP